VSDDAALSRLQDVKHIVVLMMENRSFDQMLGYLTRDRLPEVNGLTGNESNPDDRGEERVVFAWGPDETVFHPPEDLSGKILDPCHGPDCIVEQLADGNRGFIKNFLGTRKNKDGETVELTEQRYRDFPMGHYTGEHLPVYDHLARHYCVCDSWHASVPGDTWLNRCFALAGETSETVGKQSGLLQHLKHLVDVSRLENLPIFDVEAFTRHLDDKQWRWYSHDPATLRAADAEYRKFLERRDNFAYFDRRRVSFATEVGEFLIQTHDSFLDDAAKGDLRDVSWIDPNFVDLSVFDPNSNDDHPPSDVKAGQQLVLDVYEALVNSPGWEDTMLVITYDEHGGFFDHVPPPAVDDGSPYKTLGVRVPAIVVGPRVEKFVCHERFDHTSLIKTILTRFASDDAIDAMTAHVGHRRIKDANHLGLVLTDSSRESTPDRGDLHDAIEAWRQEARRARRSHRSGEGSPSGDGAGHHQELTDLADDVTAVSIAMRAAGLPPGQP
jgi:phospholipase C